MALRIGSRLCCCFLALLHHCLVGAVVPHQPLIGSSTGLSAHGSLGADCAPGGASDAPLLAALHGLNNLLLKLHVEVHDGQGALLFHRNDLMQFGVRACTGRNVKDPLAPMIFLRGDVGLQVARFLG